jgi:hypothetical protein
MPFGAPSDDAEDTMTVYEQPRRPGENEVALARVALDPAGRLEILEALPERYDYLRAVVDRVNSKPAITRLTPPPGDAPPYAVSSEVVTRDSPRFLEALSEHLAKYFRLRLG